MWHFLNWFSTKFEWKIYFLKKKSGSKFEFDLDLKETKLPNLKRTYSEYHKEGRINRHIAMPDSEQIS